MVLGKLKKVNWSAFSSPDFNPNVYGGHNFRTCGSSLLSMITNTPSAIVEKKLRTRHWSATAIKNYLKSKGWAAVEITVNSVTNGHWEDFPISEDHIVVLSLHMDAKEASWLLAHKGRLYHNFNEEPFTGTYLLNKPIQECFIVYRHKKVRKQLTRA
jgi:hypothetical protein